MAKMSKAEVQYELQRIHEERMLEIKMQVAEELEIEEKALPIKERLEKEVNLLNKRAEIRAELSAEINKNLEWQAMKIDREAQESKLECFNGAICTDCYDEHNCPLPSSWGNAYCAPCQVAGRDGGSYCYEFEKEDMCPNQKKKQTPLETWEALDKRPWHILEAELKTKENDN